MRTPPLLLAVLLMGTALFGACQTLAPAPSSTDRPVATYDGGTITYEALHAAWNRQHTGTAVADTTQELLTFLDQYLNYRLKVHEARQVGYDAQPAVQQEIRDYVQERARPAFLEAHVTAPLLDTLYQRQQQEVRTRHILIRVDENAPPEDTLAAYNQIHALRDSVQAGSDFAALARTASDDPSVQQRGQRGFEGDLGYLSAGQLVDSYEDAMYRHPVDAPPAVVRSPFGYHLIDVLDRQPRMPRTRIAHLHIRPDDDTPAAREAARARIDSLAAALLPDSTAFAEAARLYSDDARTAENGGELGWLSIQQYVPAPFRNAVRALDTDGAISEVVVLDTGFYLIQRRAAEPLPSFEEAEPELRTQLENMPRTEERRQTLVDTLRDARSVMVDTAAVRTTLGAEWTDRASSMLQTTPDSTVLAAVQPPASSAAGMQSPDTLRHEGLHRYLRSHTDLRTASVGEAVDHWIDDTVLNQAAIAWAASQPDLRQEIELFTDGLLVFELMQDSVWTAPDDVAPEATPAALAPDRYEQAYVQRLRDRHAAELYPQRLREQRASTP